MLIEWALVFQASEMAVNERNISSNDHTVPPSSKEKKTTNQNQQRRPLTARKIITVKEKEKETQLVK